MTARTGHQEARAGNRDDGVTGPVPERGGPQRDGRLTSEQVWEAITKQLFAIISYTTPPGDPRCPGPGRGGAEDCRARQTTVQ